MNRKLLVLAMLILFGILTVGAYRFTGMETQETCKPYETDFVTTYTKIVCFEADYVKLYKGGEFLGKFDAPHTIEPEKQEIKYECYSCDTYMSYTDWIIMGVFTLVFLVVIFFYIKRELYSKIPNRLRRFHKGDA